MQMRRKSRKGRLSQGGWKASGHGFLSVVGRTPFRGRLPSFPLPASLLSAHAYGLSLKMRVLCLQILSSDRKGRKQGNGFALS